MSACAELPSLTPRVLPSSSLFFPPTPVHAEPCRCRAWIQFRVATMSSPVARGWFLRRKAGARIVVRPMGREDRLRGRKCTRTRSPCADCRRTHGRSLLYCSAPVAHHCPRRILNSAAWPSSLFQMHPYPLIYCNVPTSCCPHTFLRRPFLQQ